MIIRALSLLFVLLLAACGLTPVYGDYSDATKGSATSANLSSIYIDNIPDRTGQRLKNLLMDHMYKNGRPGPSAKYRLQIASVTESIYGLGIAKDATATRSQIKLSTSMSLFDVGTGERLMTRNVRAVSSFNTLASQYTTLVTEEDARTQTIEDLARQVETQLELYFANPSAFPSQEEIDAKKAAELERGAVINRQDVDWTDRGDLMNPNDD
ncbi:MAG TPA: LPS assembly lipoprotein LptE [Alphaproteobacteria bacterium]